MKRKPRDSKAGIFADGMGIDVLYQGIMISVLVLISYFLGHYVETKTWTLETSTHGMTMAFLTMSFAEIFHCFNMRSQRESLFTMKKQNGILWLAAFASLAMTLLVCNVSFLRTAFELETIGFTEYAIAIGLGFCVLPIVEIVKCIQRRIAKKKS